MFRERKDGEPCGLRGGRQRMKMTAEGIYTVLIQEEKKRGPQAKLPMSRKTKEELFQIQT